MKKLFWLTIVSLLLCLLPLSVSASTEGEQEYYEMVMKEYSGSWYHKSTRTYTYDRYGNIIRVRLTSAGNTSGGQTTTTYEYTYNPDGTMRKKMTYKDGEYQSGTLYEYNEAGVLIRTSDLDTGYPKIIYVRDEFGNAIRQENYDSEGKLASYYVSTYDGTVLLTQKIHRGYDGYVMSSLEYDPATGVMTQISTNNKTVDKYSAGRIVRSESYQNDQLQNYTVYTYYGDYKLIANHYDEIGRKTGHMEQEFDSKGNLTLHASYNSLGEAMLYQTFAYTYPTHTHSWKINKSAESTCVLEGYKQYICAQCAQTYTEAVPLAAHTYDDLWCDTDCNACGAVREAEHLYNNACDETCNHCGYRRGTEEHQYTNDCDPSCNICGELREVEHSYQLLNSSSHHWQECELCGTKQTEEVHIYEHACDPTCEVCGYVRSAISLIHSYTSKEWERDDTHHWRGCLNCGEPQRGNKYDHIYTNACDTSCNICGYTRTITHSYSTKWSTNSDNHWYECSVCGAKKDESAHQPGVAATETTVQTCTVCGYVIKAALGHTHQYDTDWSKDETAHWHECDCGAKKDSASHKWDDGKVTTEPTTSAEGERTFTCTVCGATRVEKIDKLPAVTTTTPVTTEPAPETTSETGGEVTDAPVTTDKPVTDAPVTSTAPSTTEKTPTTAPDANASIDVDADNDGNDNGTLMIVIVVLAFCLVGAIVVLIVVATRKKSNS